MKAAICKTWEVELNNSSQYHTNIPLYFIVVKSSALMEFFLCMIDPYYFNIMMAL